MTAETTIQSNAFNFGDFLSQGVDPRTGHFAASVRLPGFQSGDLAGPTLSLTLSYNMLNPQDLGFGRGWMLNLSRFSPSNHGLLSTANGESFKVTAANGMNVPATLPEQKLEAFRFYADSLASGPYRLVHRGGLVEEMSLHDDKGSRVALTDRMIGPLGHALHLQYSAYANNAVLNKVLDHDGQAVLLAIDYGSDLTTVTLAPNASQPGLAMTFSRTGGQLNKVTLVDITGGRWTFKYSKIRGYECIRQVETPQGGMDVLEYNDSGHQFPWPSDDPDPRPAALPRVSRHSQNPGLGQPPLDTRWTYTQQNYLGNGAVHRWTNDGSDRLYEATDDSFHYGSTSTQYIENLDAKHARMRTVERRYNRFHQLVQETTDEQGHKLIRDLHYHMEAGKRFEDQPAYCQLPKTSETRWQLDGHGTRLETLEQTFDLQGNPLTETGPNGITLSYEYYPLEGAPGDCPPDPHGFMRYVKTKTITPASEGNAGAPIRTSHYRYVAVPALAGSQGQGQVLVKEEQLCIDGTAAPLRVTTYHYYGEPTQAETSSVKPGNDKQAEDALAHGRLHQQLDTLNGKQSRVVLEYAKSGTSLSDATLHTTATFRGFDTTQSQSKRSTAMLSGQEVGSVDVDGVTVQVTYDALQRVVSETVKGSGGVHPAIRRFEYQFAGPPSTRAGDQGTYGAGNRQTLIDVQGVRHTEVTDALGREVAQWRQLDENSDPVQLSATQYNALGQRLQTKTFDDYDPTGIVTLTTSYRYDAWGNLYSTTDPTGQVSVTHTEPIPAAGAAELQTWLEHPDRPGERYQWALTRFNAFGKPCYQTRLEAPKGGEQNADKEAPLPIGPVEFFYDGLGRCTSQTQTLREPQGKNGFSKNSFARSTSYRYDAFDRLVATRYDDQSEIHQAFADHSADTLAVSKTVYEPAGNAGTVVGTQCFDGLNRLIQRTVGSLTERFHYQGGSSRPYQHRQPSGYVRTYTYAPELADSPTRIEGLSQARDFSYDPRTGNVISAQSQDGERTDFTYNALGEAIQLAWTAPGDKAAHRTRLSYSRQGRRTRREDDAATPSDHTYDRFGRPEKVVQGGLNSRCEYDAWGQVCNTLTTGPDGQAECRREYDGHGRECRRTLYLPGGKPLTIEQSWSDDDMPYRRSYYVDGKNVFLEDFRYDGRGRLYECSYRGETTWLPEDRLGRPIKSQSYVFDALDNIRLVITTVVGDEVVIADHAYANDEGNPCRLNSITYDPPEYAPAEQFEYDANGCLRNDGRGRDLSYDEYRRLIEVQDTNGKTSYHYDPHDALVGTSNDQGGHTRWYYDGLSPHHSQSASGSGQYLYDMAGQPAAERLPNEQVLWQGSDLAGSVRGESLAGHYQPVHYNAYGQASPSLLGQRGFNGERRDSQLEGYPLGRGYRTYFPHLMRFNAPDSQSPFGVGGVNPYAYVSGNPVTYRDPTGHYTSTIVGPDYRPPIEQPKLSPLNRWLPVAVSVLMLVVGMLTAPPSAVGALAFTASAVVSAVGLTYNVLVAAQVLSNNSVLDTILFVADFAISAGAAAVGRKALARGVDAALETAANSSNWTLKIASVSRVNPLRGVLPRAKLDLPELGDNMQVFKRGSASARDSIRKPITVAADVHTPPSRGGSPRSNSILPRGPRSTMIEGLSEPTTALASSPPPVPSSFGVKPVRRWATVNSTKYLQGPLGNKAERYKTVF